MAEEPDSADVRWPLWLNTHRYHIAGVLFLLLIGLYGWLVYESGNRVLQPTEQVALALVSLFVSSVVGVLIGEVLVARKLNVASQLRRAHGIRQALRSLHSEIGDARQRMAARDGFDARTIDELWEEVSTHFQTALRVPISEADRIIEDWGELDAAARHRIGEEEARKQAAIDGLYKELEAARSVEAALSSVEQVVSKSMSAAVASLQDRIRDLEQAPTGEPAIHAAGTAKQLLTQGHYQKAVQVYDDIIRRYPTVHTNYLGRAKARALAGDMSGAVADLDEARDLFPGDPVIERVREQIVAGQPPTAPVSTSPASRQELASGSQSLALGRADEARAHFRNAAELGGNHYFAKLNLAMTECLAGNVRAAQELLSQLEAPPKSYIAVNKAAVQAVGSVLAGGEPGPSIESLRAHLEAIGRYSYTLSPVRFLEEGLRSSNSAALVKLEPIFECLKNPPIAGP